MCRTVADAVYVLDAIVGFDGRDADATRKASKFIPHGGYRQFFKPDGLKGKRLGIMRDPFFNSVIGTVITQAFKHHFNTLRKGGAVLVDDVKLSNMDIISNVSYGEQVAMLLEFKSSIDAYLKELVASPVRSLADLITFNNKFSKLEMINEYGQDYFLAAQMINGTVNVEKQLRKIFEKFSREGLEE
ncbi:hypothetical protein IFM89_027980 [Coptis chinensis]|uniref:Uncharacterized protein n=1 Tax=Coptis chinensis TaxID=261450 RepID=A0A835LCR1_9MAGN|nr:hypothetical protein IFM89_027980 [Coptis chinensis]